jgi:predicted signal transduction protein with EAL and GGDEF domain
MVEQNAEELDHREGQHPFARDESEPIPLSRPETNPIQVLIADDDAISRRLLQRTLERSGFDVVCVNDGSAAAEQMLAPYGPRIAILDWMMPGKDGPSICRELRACTTNPYVYLILLTSRGAKEDIVMGLEAGADDYLTKPYNVDEMKARIRAGQRILHLQDRLIHDACHDALTKLPNRAFFLRRLSDSANKARDRENYRFAVLFVDIDRFKTINDSIGHIAGDELMKGVALRLLHAVRTETAISRKKDAKDMGKGFNDVVARIGGDEFVILLDDISSVDDATQVAERIQTVLKPPFLISGQEVYISASIGISEGEGRGVDTTTVLRGADTAMYKAKTQGRARYEVSDPIGQAAAAHALRLEHDLRLAIDKQELEVQYQPIVALEDCRITGFEALARWKHPELGYVPPDTFIPIAEDTGLIRSIGKWVMREACRQMRDWNAEFAPNDPVVVCVNIAPRQFEPRKLLACVSEILAETGLGPASLDLEVTENLTMQDAEQAGEILRDLAALGVSISLDDFGTGYSSLSYLHRFPIGTLKIDRSFVAELETSKESREIIQTIIALGHGLGMKVIAEGIENVEQMELLRGLRCDLGQGYLFSRPARTQQVSEMLTARRSGGTLMPKTAGPKDNSELSVGADSVPANYWTTAPGELASTR